MEDLSRMKSKRDEPSGVLARIDQYELVRELGGGGFGTVYLAKDTVSGVEYAVKGLPPLVKNNSEELERIRDNFALVSRLSHPNIAAALHLHPARDVYYNDESVQKKLHVMQGDTLMVMAYVSGVTLSKLRGLFPGGKMPLPQALEIARQIAAALDYAHEQRIIHRDIKPSNVMVETKKDGKLVARVLDFGLAAEIRLSMGCVSREVRDTSGTRPYMAPEQWLAEKQGPATDQYALAVLVHELLTGEVPFASAFVTNDFELMKSAVTTIPFVAPDELPHSVRAALARALAKTPAERFASCGAFVAAVLDRDDGTDTSDKEKKTDAKGHEAPKKFAECVRGAEPEKRSEPLKVAVTARTAAEWAKEEAVRAETSKYAPKDWAEASALEREGKAAFDEMSFAEAGAMFTEAAMKFRYGAERAKKTGEAVKAAFKNAKRYRDAYTPESVDAESAMKLENVFKAAEKAVDSWEWEEAIRYFKEYAERCSAFMPQPEKQSGGVGQINKEEKKHHFGIGKFVVHVAVVVLLVLVMRWRWNTSPVPVTSGTGVIDEAIPLGPPTDGECRTQTLPGGVKMKMVYVAPGSFQMGSEDGDENEKPVHTVRITKGYWIGKYPVLQNQWSELVSSNNVTLDGKIPKAYFSAQGTGKEDVNGMETSDFPMESISWDDCDALVKALNLKEREKKTGRIWSIPTEAQWEFAARGGNKSKGYTYSGGNDLSALGWYKANSDERTHSVRVKDIGNELGIVGMSGNVWEWCYDKYDEAYYKTSRTDDPCNDEDAGFHRVQRGGSWYNRDNRSRCTYRGKGEPTGRWGNVGFRLCCSDELRDAPRTRPGNVAPTSSLQEGIAKTLTLPGGVEMRFCWCPAGSFKMGSPPEEEGRYDDERQHPVTLTKGFWLAETEVTQGQWKRLMNGETVLDLARKALRDDTLYEFSSSKKTIRDFYGWPRDKDPADVCGIVADDAPVYWVSWNEAVAFCRRLTAAEREAGSLPDGYEYRLPTEAEWEYACRAGTASALPNGRDIRILGKNNAPALDGIAWYGGNSSVGFEGLGVDTSGWPEKQYPGERAFAREVKGKLANAWGLYDMIGNVREWCADWYGEYPYGAATDPTGPSDGVNRVFRGGSWDGIARGCRSAFRGWDEPGCRINGLGFRPALAPSH